MLAYQYFRVVFPITIFILLFSMMLSPSVKAGGVVIEGKHQFISVVPAPGKVVIDDKLDDWDLSGEILTYEFLETAEKRHARTAMMYDADNLYITVTFRDDTPMMNMVNGKVDKSRGWDSDAYQVRLVNDPGVGYPIQAKKELPIGRDLIFWYFTGNKEPWLAVTDFTIVPPGESRYDFENVRVFSGTDSGVAFAPVDGGYILEAKVPWKRLDMTGPPAPGTKIAMTSQHLWGNDTGTRYSTSVNDITAPGGGFTYQRVTGWGYALFEPTGKLARDREELPKPMAVANTLSFTYNLPQAGFASIGIFNTDGDLVRTLLTAEKRQVGENTERWDGLNDFGDVLPAGKYTAKMLTHQGITQEWIVSLHNSGNPPWVTSNGKGSWGGDHGVPLDVAASADRIFLLWDSAEAGWHLIGCTPDGQKQWGTWVYQNYPAPNSLATDGKLVYVSQGAGITVHDGETGKPLTFSNNKRGFDIEGGGVTDIVYNDKHLYALAKGKVYKIQLDPPKIISSINVGEGTKGLAIVTNSNFLLTIAADGTILRIDPPMLTKEVLFAAPLVNPFDLTISPDGKKIYVSDQGRTENVVKVFSYPDGNPAGTVGKPGGRPAIGKFDPNGLFMPGGLAFDLKGRLWVTEMDQSPKRISVWQPVGKQGKLVNEYFGGSAYSVGLSADPENPENVYIHNTRWIVDYEKRTAKLDCTFMRPGYYGLQPAASNGFMGYSLRIRHMNGRTFLFSATSVWEMIGDHAVPIFAAAGMERAPGWPIIMKPNPWAWSCYWYDLNHDGFMQSNEVESVEKRGGIDMNWGTNMGDDLALEIGTARVGVKEWRDSLPIWNKPYDVKPVFQPKENLWGGVNWNKDLSRCYTLETNEGYYNNDMRRNGIACYTPDGKRLWRFKAGIGMDVNAPLTKVGEIRGAQKFIGFIQTGPDKGGELVTVNGYYGNYNMLNEDGLFVHEFCHDNRRGYPQDSNNLNPEGFSGFIFQHPKTKKVYLMGGDSDGRIWEVKGLDTIKRTRMELTITDADVKNATQALTDFQRVIGSAAAATTINHAPAAVLIDGMLNEWDFSQANSITAGPGRGGKAISAYDDKFLYVAYRVADDSPFLNTGADWPYLFKTGDLVDMMLCTTAGADPNRKAGKGDMRLLFAPFQGKPIVILNQKVADGGPAVPLKFTSPGQFEDYERVVMLTDAKIAVKTTPDGYTLEAAIPLAEIGFNPQPGQNYPLDFGILYGDTTGTKTILRSYWANRKTSIVGDIPTESRITPPNMGTAKVE
ncbi:MAG: FlgD immunoglobulin-like domain containing protein [bacterium]